MTTIWDADVLIHCASMLSDMARPERYPRKLHIMPYDLLRAIGRAYFNISGERERWLYKVVRKHVGGAGRRGRGGGLRDCHGGAIRKERR